MRVDEIMTRSIRTVKPDAAILEVASIMCLYRIPGLPVVVDDELVGFISEKDVLSSLFPSIQDIMEGEANLHIESLASSYADTMHLKVKDLMTQNVLTVSPDMHILKAAAKMVSNNFRRIPVSDGNRLVGIFSLGDMHKAIFQQHLSNS